MKCETKVPEVIATLAKSAALGGTKKEDLNVSKVEDSFSDEEVEVVPRRMKNRTNI